MFPSTITSKMMVDPILPEGVRTTGSGRAVSFMPLPFVRLIMGGIPGSPNPGIPPMTGPTGPGGNAPPGVNPPPPPPPLTPEQLLQIDRAKQLARTRAETQPRIAGGDPSGRGGQFVPQPSAGPNTPTLSGPAGSPPPEPNLVIDARTGQPAPSTPVAQPTQAPPPAPSTPIPGSQPSPISAQPVPPSTMPGQPSPYPTSSTLLRNVLEKTASGRAGIVPLILTSPTNDVKVGAIQFVGNFGFQAARGGGYGGGLVANAVFAFRQVAHAFDAERKLEASQRQPQQEVLDIIAKREALDALKRDRLIFSSKPSDGI